MNSYLRLRPPFWSTSRPVYQPSGRGSIITVLLASSLLMMALSHADRPPDPALTDSDITNAVEHRFLTDAVLLNNQVDVKTHEGIVTLSGTAGHLIARDRAVKLAETIRGVRGVVNTISLTKSGRNDIDVRMDVAAALIYDAATDELRLKAEVKDGVVTLGGTVQSYGWKQLAVRVVKGVKGVQQVQDNILVETTSPRTDADIREEITRMIATDVWLDGAYIAIEVNEGVVNLAGQVGTPAQQDRAGDVAWTTGVKFVHTDNLKIDPGMRRNDQSKETVTVRTDDWIKAAVRDSLSADPRVNSFRIGVVVDASRVTLTGVVDNIKAGLAAGQDASNTVGVARVRNLLKVRGQTIADEKLEQDVNAALLRDAALDGNVINVKARGGVVTLSGHVDSFYQKAQADDVASRANGTRHVKNQLSLNITNVPYYFNPFWEHTPFSPQF